MGKHTTDKNPKGKKGNGKIYPEPAGLGSSFSPTPNICSSRPRAGATAGIFVKSYSAQILTANFVHFYHLNLSQNYAIIKTQKKER